MIEIRFFKWVVGGCEFANRRLRIYALALMHIPRYWAGSEALISHGKRKAAAIECWGWSDQAAADAKQKADAREGGEPEVSRR